MSSPPKIERATPRPHPKLWRVLGRGLRRQCPHCGRAPMFRKWFTLHKECASCHWRFEQSPGDTWALWLIGDRVFLGLLIIAVFLIFQSTSWTLAGIILAVTVVPLIATMPHRMGLCLAFDYLSRVYFGDPEQIPPCPGSE